MTPPSGKHPQSVLSKTLTLAVVGWLCGTSPLWAVTNPEEELEATQKDMQQAQQRSQALSKEYKQLQDELKTLQDKMVKMAATMQKTEAELSDAEDKLRILSDELKTKKETQKAQQAHLSALLMAELSLSRTPPEAILMMPQPPMEIMKASHALGMASESIRQEALSLSLQLSELNALKEIVTEHRDQLASIQAGFDKQRRELMGQLADRTALQNKLGKRQKEEEDTLQRLAKKASDLRDLVTGLQKEQVKKEEKEAKHNKPSARSDSEHLRSFVDAKGHIHAPASGQVTQSFGASTGKNTTSKGTTMTTRKGAQVTAPYDSEVVFTGPFLNYGQMIILRHSDDFHTLLAGLTKIDVRVGQFLLEGEPIGAMGEGDDDNKNDRTLYIELRKDNQPVNPAAWINGLNKKK